LPARNSSTSCGLDSAKAASVVVPVSSWLVNWFRL
jgi:hypothetical protein